MGSDNGLGPNEEEIQRDNRGYQKYYERAIQMVQDPHTNGRKFGLPPNTIFWVVKLSRYNHSKQRWVRKGPVILYFVNLEKPRLMANYLYSTKSTCLDLELNEHFDLYLKNYNNNHCQFSTFKLNAVKQALIRGCPNGGTRPQGH